MDKVVVNLDHTKKKYYRFLVEIMYLNGEIEVVECTFFGGSLDNPQFMLFSNSHPDDKDETADIPDLMVNTRNVLRIKTINIEEVDR
ncbi:MAG: hypothetical protein KJO69_01160 [Gammaproteobacteria bacterium]|nr:hypothetical protein [Gammaproteobacteria bacterium]